MMQWTSCGKKMPWLYVTCCATTNTYPSDSTAGHYIKKREALLQPRISARITLHSASVRSYRRYRVFNNTWCVQVLRSPKEAFAAAMQSWRERCETCVCLQGDYVEK